ncbi:CheR family methyltransferase [Geomonas sp.]|uniref:CheR family methyltransferase n=1 Tax=Geomonas sp. TaxID=2651584 RepID=UPI002B46C44C|nr:CheR family methyltransferase [Geomonas sp.]HJV34547.1 CheR family methyltransferase [Geomonas sp.]
MTRNVKLQTNCAARSGSEPAEGRFETVWAILEAVKAGTGHDFTSYKMNTVMRRIERRMAVRDADGLEEYLSLLTRETPQEAHALCQEILIGVTGFFRDPDAFAILERDIIPALFAGRAADEPVRIWHPCCATGEEAYSMAILVREFLDEHGLDNKVHIFASDLDQSAIARARCGIYSDRSVSLLGEQRLNRFFSKVDEGWRVGKPLREMIVFAHHSVIKDPPFSRLDLLVCRNFLIYLTPDLQRRLIALFHQILKPGGFLFLGSTETLGSHVDLFAPVDKKWKIYRTLGGVRRAGDWFPLGAFRPAPLAGREPSAEQGPHTDAAVVAERMMTARYLPPWVVVNDRYEVMYASRGTDRFLSLPVGEPTRDLLKMAREELRPALRAAIYRALAEKEPVLFSAINLDDFGAGAAGETVNVTAHPLPSAVGERLSLVVFESGPSLPRQTVTSAAHSSGAEEGGAQERIRRLEEHVDILNQQLLATSEQLETSHESYLSANEELISINEEFESANRELHAANEELEASKEELQALNEELATINAELRAKVEALHRASNDMDNLLTSSQIATLFLDLDLRIKRYTPAMAAIFDLAPADIGRSFRHLAAFLDCEQLVDGKGKLEELLPLEREVRLFDEDRHFVLRVFPYRTAEGAIDGTVITLMDITLRKQAEVELQHSNQRLNLLAESAGELLASDSPEDVVDAICRRVMQYLDCQLFLNFLTEEKEESLLLNAWAGISVEDARKIERIDYGSAVCGCVAQAGSPVVIEDLPDSTAPRTELIRSYRVLAYAVHPLVARGRVLGTLSFGTSSRSSFSADDLALMKTVADQVAIAIEQKRLTEAMRRGNDELERRVRERTEQLASTIDVLMGEIAERQEIEESLRRLNRLYMVLNEIDQAIVRATDRASLFRDFCRIATEQGGFLLAWVGLLDETKRLHITASSGATDYLKDLRLTVDDTPEGTGPSGIAIRNGSYYVCNDFQNDPCTLPWQERAEPHGIRAIAAIALKEGGRVIGTLTLYAREVGFFDHQQVALLRQMGADLSFALENLSREERRRDAELALQEETLERLLAVEELREKERLLIQQSRQAALGEMINNIAHQWRQPLNTLGLVVQELSVSNELGLCNQEHLENSVGNVMQIIGHMSRTIDDFRNFFAPEKEMVDFRVRQVIEKVTSIVDASLKPHQIELDLVSSGDPVIHGYPNEYSQVLLNILLNARDALVERMIEDPRIQMALTQEQKRVVVTIRDNAGGIPDHILEKIFDPYFTTKGPDRGTGIGLYMSKAIIEKNMNGKVTAANHGHGAEFRIEVSYAQSIR